MAGRVVARMYKTTIILLFFIIGTTSYYLHVFPFSVIVAIIACTAIEITATKLYLKKRYEIPYTAIITGMIIGCVAPSNASVLILVLASAIAVLSKIFIRLKSTNIFNPAALGLLVALALFGIGDNWWVASPIPVYGMLVTITPLLVICAYEARRLILGISFAVTSFAASLLTNGFIATHSFGTFVTAVISVNFFLAFIMVSEPKTSPNKNYVQMFYGISIAAVVSIMGFYKVPYAMLIPIIIGNMAYAIYRLKSGSR